MVTRWMVCLFGVLICAIPVHAEFEYLNDGNDEEHMICGSDSSIDDLVPISIMWWAKVNEINSDFTYCGVVNKQTIGSAPIFQVSFGEQIASTTFDFGFFQAFSTTNGFWGADDHLNMGTWYCLIVTYDGSSATNVATLYVDGIAVDSTADPQASGTRTSDASDSIIVGIDHADPNNPESCQAEYGELAVWGTTELTAAEALQLCGSRVRRMPLQVAAANLVMYVPFDDHPDGANADGLTFQDYKGVNDCVGNDGDTGGGLPVIAGEVLSYPPQ